MGVSQLVHVWLHLCQHMNVAINVITVCQFALNLAQTPLFGMRFVPLFRILPDKPALGHMSVEQQVPMQAVLIPSVTVGGGDSMPGCFTHEGGVTITKGQLFLWEMIMTFVLVSTVYAVAVTKPGHGNIGPLAVGFSLFASAFIGEQEYTHCTATIPTI